MKCVVFTHVTLNMYDFVTQKKVSLYVLSPGRIVVPYDNHL